MARARSGGGGWVAATVILGLGFVISLIVMIIVAVQIGAAQEQALNAQRDLDVFVKGIERTQGDVKLAIESSKQTRPHKTVVRFLIDENRQLKGIIQGVDSTSAGIEATMRSLGLPDGATLLDQISSYRKSLDIVQTRLVVAQKALEKSGIKLVQVEQDNARLDNTYLQNVEDLKQNLIVEREDYQQANEQKETMVRTLDEHLQDVRQQTSEENARLRSVLAQRDEQIRQLRARVDELVHFTKEGTSETGVIELDGQIVAIDRDNDLVYINLTQADRMQPGLTFEVFKQNSIVRADESHELMGVATIEVVRATQTSSVARIVRLDPRAGLTIGDQVINIAYDRTATYEFVVHGTFDINNIGAATMADNRRVQGMIQRWGGKVVDELTYQTDYLVLGIPPKRPEALSEDATLVEIEINEAKKRIWAQYRALAAEAEKLKIPILNQNRFLRLTGYYRR